MTPEQFFLEIPIYDRSEEKHYRDQNAKKRERVERTARGDQELAETASGSFDAFEAFPWDYNRLFGFVGLHAGRGTIKGELYRRGHLFAAGAFAAEPPARKRLLARKQIFCWGKAIELWYGRDDSDEDILNQLLEALRALPKGDPTLKGRVVQVTGLERIGPFVQWRRLVGLEG